ncbi:MAG TPA: recombinase family protein [Pyrinomonadaceae bacterium]|jgi:site-specific DNA recombinase
MEQKPNLGQAIVYCRVSTAKQEDNFSLESQANACIKHAESLGYYVAADDVIKEVFTGAELFDRPRLSDVLTAIRAKEYQALVVYAIDRLSRDIAHLSIISDMCERAGAKLIFVTENLDSTPDGKLLQSVRGYVAEIERLKIRERCVRGKRQRAQSGLVHNAGSELYGYRRDKERGVREIYEPEASVIREMYIWILEGVSTRKIIQRLNERGTPAPSEGKRTFKDGRKAFWGKGSVTRILTETTYKGEAWTQRFKSGKHWNEIHSRPREEWVRLPDHTTPAIITPESWEAVQTRLKTNCGDQTRNEKRPDLLRGLVYCQTCERKMLGQNEHGRFRVYRCSSRATPLGACGSKRIPAADCEATIWEQVERVLNNPEVIQARLEQMESCGQGTRTLLEAQLASARQARKKVEDGLKRLIIRAQDEEDEEVWQMYQKQAVEQKEAKKRLDVTIAEVEGRLATEFEVLSALTSLTEYCQRVRANLATFGFNEKRLALEALGAKVIGCGRNWRLDFHIPVAGQMPISCCSSAHRVRARRCSPSACRPSFRRSNLKKLSN